MTFRHWTNEHRAMAIDLVARLASDAECMAAVGRNLQACKSMLNRRGIGVRPKRGRKKMVNRVVQDFWVPKGVYEEASRRTSTPRSITAIVMGDPPPGYSALDRK